MKENDELDNNNSNDENAQQKIGKKIKNIFEQKIQEIEKNDENKNGNDNENNNLSNLATEALRLKSESYKLEKEKQKQKLFNEEKRKSFFIFWNNILMILCMIFFSSSVFMQFEIENRYKIKSKLKKTFGFDSLKNIKLSPFNYSYDLISDIKKNLTENSDNIRFIFDNKYQIISNLRFTQRKIKLVNDKLPFQPLINDKLFYPKWSSDTILADSKFNKEKEESENFSQYFIFDKKNSYLEKGGFVFNYTFQESENLNFDNLLILFLNENAAAIISDFTLYNFERRYFCTVVLINQIYDIGISSLKFKLYINDRDLYQSKMSKVRLVFEILFVLCFILSTVFFIMKLKFKISVKRERIEMKEMERKTNLFKLINNLSIVKILFQNIFSIFQLLHTILGFLSIIFWIIYLVKMSKLNKELDLAEKGNDPISNTIENKLIKAGKILDIYKDIVILEFFFLFFKLVDIASDISRRAKMFIVTIKSSFEDILSFFIFLIVILLGFSSFTWLYYGRRLNNFLTLNYSFQQNFAFFLGIIDSDIFYQMYSNYGAMTCCYFIILIVIVRFIILKIILAILLHYYDKANKNYLKVIVSFEKNESGMINIKQNAIFRFMNWYSNFVNGILDFLTCRKDEFNVNKINIENNEPKLLFKCSYSENCITNNLCPEIKESNDEKIEIKKLQGSLKRTKKMKSDMSLNEEETFQKGEKERIYLSKIFSSNKINMCDAQFEEDYEFMMRNAYFDSEKDTEKVKQFYEHKYKRFFYQALFYLFFLIVVIIVFLFNVLAPWKFKILHAVGTALNSTNDLLNTSYNQLENSKVLNWDSNITLMEINSIKEIRDFTFNRIGSYFAEVKDEKKDKFKYAFFDRNYLIDDKILITLRREESSSREKDIKENKKEVSIRKEENLFLTYLNYEEKNYFKIKINKTNETQYFQWEKYHTYKKYGGYYFEYNLSKSYMYNDSDFQKELINEYTNYVIIEFFLQNFEYEVVEHITIFFTIDYGIYVKSKFSVELLKYNEVAKPLDVVKIFFEFIFVFLFIGVIFLFIKSIKENNFAYNKWYRDIIAPLNIKIRDIRNKIEPEFIRKIQVIFGLQQFFDIIIIGLSIGIIYGIIGTLVKQKDLKKLLKKDTIDIYKIRDCLYVGEYTKSIIEYFGVVIIFLSCVKMFSLINLGKFFSLLIRTFDNSKGNILIFIILIILIHPSFIFYSHLAFGENDNDFYKIQKSIKTCLMALYGYIDHVKLYEDESDFGPIFFFLYLIFINLILLNLFVAILYTSYLLIKEEIIRRTEIWNPLNVFCFCIKRKIHSLHKFSINNEFDFDRQENKFQTNTLIYKKKLKYDDFIKHEKEQMNYLNDEIYGLKKRRHDATLAYDTQKIGREYVFDDNLYKNIKYSHLRAFIIDEYNKMLNVCENLDQDILQIEEAIEHLKKHEKYMKYDNLIENIENKNKLIKLKCEALDENFLKLNNDLKNVNMNNLELENAKLKKKHDESENSKILNDDNSQEDNKEDDIINDNDNDNENENDDENN